MIKKFHHDKNLFTQKVYESILSKNEIGKIYKYDFKHTVLSILKIVLL